MDLKFVSIFFCFVLFLHSSKSTFADQNDLETYIVQLELPDDFVFSDSKDLYLWHQSFLPTTSANSDLSSRIIYSYRHVFNGFAAMLSSDEVKMMEKQPGFVSARPQRVLQLHTTHSPSFLGLHQNAGLWNVSNSGKGVIIGLLDSGINPKHPSFNDYGMSPPPTKWKGKCEFNYKACNNKLIGARNLVKTATSPLDGDGHGTHTSSTAAGNFVIGANFLGNANGTAVGIAPRAHVAMYRVCDTDGCPEVFILAGYDAAIEDGVDVISISIGAMAVPPYEEIMAIGAYRAIEKGIFVSCSAGNSGPSSATVENGSPWILTVGASSTDRKISAVAVLGNGAEYEGESAFQSTNISKKLLPLINGGDCESLDSIDVRGKIVLCGAVGSLSGIEIGQEVKKAGGAAMILKNEEEQGYTTFVTVHVLPATHVSYLDGLKIIEYIKSTSTPVATISFKGTRIGDKHAPVVASFSSRGPYTISQGILKPDIIGPGVNILAAWIKPPAGVIPSATSTFNIISGTSMSCPHLAGVAALLKSAHPEWSPAAIKSAIMTTADLVNLGNNPIQDEKLNPADLLTIGSGHVNPSKANNPGLVYDIQPQDYVPYLCGLKYTDQQVSTIVNKKVHCTSSIAEAELNYPSFSIDLGSSAQTYTRTVTNVGEANSTYTVEVIGVEGVVLSINPRILKFSALNQKLSYEVTFKRSTSTDSSQGYINWSSGKYSLELPDDFVFSDSKDLYLWHQSFLPTTSANSDLSSRIIYSYRHVYNGFAAMLSSDEVKMMENQPGFVSARPQRVLQLHTTHSPSFLGLHKNVGLWNASNSSKGVIIGLLDTGINPKHPSFNDYGMPPPPAKWKGKCEFNYKACNNKLIGARNFVKTAKSPLDGDGHGTHTSSTAAGNFVDGANFLGNANGTAVGIAPRAHVAMYRVCDDDGCPEAFILAGYDAAIEDRVDVISISIGATTLPLYEETMAIGAYRAIEKGIFVSCSSGNSGPSNRKINVVAVLGNGAEYEGESAFQSTNTSRKLLPLIDGGYCEALVNIDVRGKIVLCGIMGSLSVFEKGQEVRKAGTKKSKAIQHFHVLPATHVSYIDGLKIRNYTESASTPVATISFKGTRIGDKHAPVVAYFSSRGPYNISRGILKPDIIGPGVNILAAWIKAPVGVKPSATSTFNIISGTSMSCPHLAGVAALIKSAHPEWSPAAIKSAIMTTADLVNLGNNPIQDEKLNPADLHTIGSGHPQDYVPYLCGLNYTDKQVSTIVNKKVHCTLSIAEAELNYPSFSIDLGSSAQTYTRTVTNVGEANSTYTVKVIGVEGVALSIILKFSALNQKLSYQVTFKRTTSKHSSQGYIIWSSAKYSVRSPISIFKLQ
ncbi:hypothetical protein H5410_007571 [Solanum commersonii]|uniref:Subtilisin-like protease SBT1.7 n=1 Tax=Solanum commersonii TaxID=4109 RepID=A0A9J6AD24_SOLCO|nr:hypothetical protein H5410_007571 [Solanum commersonii]